MENIIELKNILSYPKDIVIISHRNPDGDAIGSSMAFRYFLESFGHVVKVVYPSDYPNTFEFIKGIDECLIYDNDPDKVEELIKKADIISCLDFNSLDRIDKMGLMVSESKAKKILIDHHLDPEPFSDFELSETSASSTCELVYKFIQLMDEDRKLNTFISELLFIGLITDTGSFKYSTNPYTYEVASSLKSKGADDYKIQDLIHNTMTTKQIALLGHCLANRLEIIPEYGAGIITLSKQDYADFDIGRGDTEGIVNYILMMQGMNVAAFITEQPTIVKLSLRSKGDISVQDMARKYFNGGGHKNASGGALYSKLDSVVEKFKTVLPEFVEKKK